MALDLLSEKALAGEVEHDYCHEAEAFFWVGVYDTACYDKGRTVDHAVPAQWNSLGANEMRKNKRDYLSSLNNHIATPSQKDVWEGLYLLKVPLTERDIFERPTKPNPLELSVQLLGPKKSFDASVRAPEAVRHHFLLAKDAAEKYYSSLLNKTSTSSS
ncbi:hypothetical protein M408DRAFT_254820 [Serendipita vermifera MAFF 305830]|uniref:Uncharacterized protein n=1 Tax=Serendipita vermifera MAFF 305830 TaxID=933852 RepID=A0A0C3BG93_SERVB|nr:hypothetical protein M408DRAFT_254820 [Serendipita vermifera MAFF 305830]